MALAKKCAPSVHLDTWKALVKVESGMNPFAVGVVDGKLSRQPKTLDEAIELVDYLERQGFNYSLGLSQVNKYNLPRRGLTVEQAFDPCQNLQAGAYILTDCYQRAMKQNILSEQEGVQAALSCYYSGNFERGFKTEPDGSSYVQRVVNTATAQAVPGKSNKLPAITVTKTGKASSKMASGSPSQGTTSAEGLVF